MRKLTLSLFILTAIILGLAGSCKKSNSGGGGGNPGGEANLQVTTNPPSGSVQPASPDIDFPLSVTITSAMPPQGVIIDVSAKKDGSADPAFFTASTTTSAPVSNFTITNTPLNVVILVTVTVTSRTSSTNKWTGTYRYSRK